MLKIVHRLLNVSAKTSSAKDNQKLLKPLSKEFKRSIYCNEYKTKSETKNTTNEYKDFLKSNVFEVN